MFAVSMAARADVVDVKTLPGRCVRVAAVNIGFGGEHDAKIKLALEHLQTAADNKVDIACLPEEFAGAEPEAISGPTVTTVAAEAKRLHMWVVCPIKEKAGEEIFNTAVLINREGGVAGYYRKIFPVWGENLRASGDGVKVFDTDFGRIAIFICFDLNFPEIWDEAYRKGAELILWPSAYGGGDPLNAMAMLYNYYIVPVGWGNIIDIAGKNIEMEKPRKDQFIATIDLDWTYVHKDFNYQKMDALLEKHKGDLEREDVKMAGCWILRSIKPGIRVRDLCRDKHIETLREYRLRSRDEVNKARAGGIDVTEELYKSTLNK
jgi:hypothetical protein